MARAAARAFDRMHAGADPAALRTLAVAIAQLPALATVTLDVAGLGLAPDAARALEADCRRLWRGTHSMGFRLGPATPEP